MFIRLPMIISDVHKDLSSLRMKPQTESTNGGRVYLYMNHELIDEPHFNLIFDIQINDSKTCLFSIW